MLTMKNILRCALLVGASLLSLNGWADNFEFQTQRLKSMAETLQLASLDTLQASSMSDAYTYKGRKLHVCTNDWGQISHIGYALVHSGVRETEAWPVVRFAERYLLELDLPSEFTKAVRLNRDQVEYFCAENFKPSDLKYEDTFSYDAVPLKSYSIKWERDGKPLLKLSFPMDAQLILGANAIELEYSLTNTIVKMDSLGVHLSEIDSKALKGRNDTFLSPMICNKLFVREDSAMTELVFDKEEQHESICNFALTGWAPTAVALHLTVDKYGYTKQDLSLTYPQLIRFLQAEKCKLYFGVKKHSDTMAEGTLFAVNKLVGYCHVIKLEIPLSIVNDEPVGVVKARMYGYIPQHNLSNDYF